MFENASQQVVCVPRDVELVIEEHTPLMKTVDIRTDVGVRDISLFLTTRQIEPELVNETAAADSPSKAQV